MAEVENKEASTAEKFKKPLLVGKVGQFPKKHVNITITDKEAPPESSEESNTCTTVAEESPTNAEENESNLSKIECRYFKI